MERFLVRSEHAVKVSRVKSAEPRFVKAHFNKLPTNSPNSSKNHISASNSSKDTAIREY